MLYAVALSSMLLPNSCFAFTPMVFGVGLLDLMDQALHNLACTYVVAGFAARTCVRIHESVLCGILSTFFPAVIFMLVLFIISCLCVGFRRRYFNINLYMIYNSFDHADLISFIWLLSCEI